MPNPSSSATPPDRDRERAKRDVWARTLSQIPTTFGKIVYLASLRNDNTGRYQHFGLAQLYTDDEADVVLRQSHEEVFGEWLNFPLEQQRRDLEQYLESVEDDKTAVLRTWLTLAPYRNLIPAQAGAAERELYISDLELILELLRDEFSPSS